MTIDSVLLSSIFRLALAVLTALLGLVVLVRGRRLPWLFSGAAAFLLGLLLVRILEAILGDARDNTSRIQWEDWIPVVAGVLGALAGKYRIDVAYALIGISTGGALAIWATRLVLPEDSVLNLWSALGFVITMGLGMLFVVRFREVALIVLSAGVGPALIIRGLNLPLDSALVAALGLAAGVACLVIQYHDYLLELREAHRKQEVEGGETPGLAGGVGGETGIAGLPAS